MLNAVAAACHLSELMTFSDLQSARMVVQCASMCHQR